MKIYRKIVIDIATGHVLSEDSFEYGGPIAEAKASGQQQASTAPPPWVQAAQSDLVGQAKNLSSSATPMTAPTNVDQQAGMDATRGAASNYANLFANSPAGAGAGALGQLLNPNVLDPASNPGFAGALGAAIRPIQRQFTESVLPGIRSSALASGMYGGSRQGIAEGVAGGRFADSIGDVTSRMVSDQYNQSAGRMLQASALAPQYAQLQAAAAERPGQLLMGLGDYRQGLEQQAVSDPWQRLEWLRGFIPGSVGSTTTQPGPRRAGGAGALGGALAGAQLGSFIPGIGTAIGAGVGGLAGLFS